uniref:Ig-like domain-containing protein n=1 Tax=Mastacembelus armatus TaxID=205130 RepID=A0A7N8WRT8_9TELE
SASVLRQSLSFSSCLLNHLNGSIVSTGQYRLICPTPLIKAAAGEDVRLPCLLDPGLDLSNRTVDWTRVNDSKVVFSYRSRMINDIDQLEQYRNRTRLSREDLSVGNMELQMFSAQLSDSGRYRCLVPQLRLSCTTSLIVGQFLHWRSPPVLVSHFLFRPELQLLGKSHIFIFVYQTTVEMCS